MTLAVKHAILKRDVSHLTFPDQVQVLPASKEKISSYDKRMPLLDIAPPTSDYKKAVDVLQKAKRPVFIVGHGARFSMTSIIKLAEKLNAPVMTTFKAKGQISDKHPLGCGVLGRSGTPVASHFMNESDLLVVIGSSFLNHTGITPKKPIIQIDFDPLALAKFHEIHVTVFGEIGRTVDLLLKESLGAKKNQKNEIKQRREIWKSEKEKRLLEDHNNGISSISIFTAMNNTAPDDAIMCVNVGNNAYSFGRYFESVNHTFLMSGYLGSIGFALPAAIGAWAADGESPHCGCCWRWWSLSISC